MSGIMMVVVLVASSVLQTLIPSVPLLGGAKAPILLASVLYYALTRDTTVMLTAALLGGFLHDVMSQIPLGHSVFCFCAAGWVTGYFRSLVLTDSVVTTTIFGGAASLCVTIVFYLMLLQDGMVAYSWGWLGMRLLGSLLLGMICTPIVFHFVGLLDRLVGNVETEQSIDVVE
jgi:rod shape-determining protein MreD